MSLQKPKAVFNWSGGKDSSLALYEVLKSGEFDIRYLLTSVNESFNRISMHGVRVELLEEQARQIGIPLLKLMVPENASMESYNRAMTEMVNQLKAEEITYSIFGDIFLEDLRKYREEQLAKAGMKAYFPLWKRDTKKLVEQFIADGFKSVLVCVNGKNLDRSFAGRLIDESLLRDLPAGVDPCGENGEYHSFVFEGPIFKNPIRIKKGEVVERKYEHKPDTSSDDKMDQPDLSTVFYYCDLIPG